MSNETSSFLILIAIIAAAILVPLLFIGALCLIFLPVVKRRRAAWRAAAAKLGLQCDRTSMWGVRELPVRIFWQNEGQSVGRMDFSSAVLAGRHDMRGGRAGLRYVYCRAMFDPPLGLGLNLTRSNGHSLTTPAASTAFEKAFIVSARQVSQARQIFHSTVGDLFAQVAQSGWQLSATDDFVQIRLGGDYFSQFPEKQPGLLASALDTAVACAGQLQAVRRGLQ